ncbi:MAG: hypothetical protein QW548_00890 [Candidatus Aenigmatarchaeota archaeon]
MNFRKFLRLLDVPITDLFKRETYRKIEARAYAEKLQQQAEAVMNSFISEYKIVSYNIREGIMPIPPVLDGRSEFSYLCDQLLEAFTEKLKGFVVDCGVGEEDASKLNLEEKRVGIGKFLAATKKCVEEAKWRIGFYWFDGAALALEEWKGYWQRNGLDSIAALADPAISKLREIEAEYKPLEKVLESGKSQSSDDDSTALPF